MDLADGRRRLRRDLGRWHRDHIRGMVEGFSAMSKFVHHANLPGVVGPTTDELVGIKWPSFPWKCPGCRELYETPVDAFIIATLDQPLDKPETATFLCATCDLRGVG
jgi:hypothetical protein